MPIFGNNVAGGFFSELNADTKRVNKFTLSEGGTVTKLSVYLDGLGSGSGGQAVRAVVYDDDGTGGNPGTLKAQSVDVTIPDGQTAGWVDFTITSPVALAAGDYWLGLHVGASSSALRVWRDNVGSDRADGTDTFVGGASDPFGAVTSGAGVLSVYATYTATGGAAAPAHRATSRGSGTATTSLTINKPTGVVAGDVMVAVVHTDVSSLTTDPIAPTGWTKLQGPASQFYGSAWAYAKVAGSAEPASYTWTMASAGNVLGFAAAYSGASGTLDAHEIDYTAAAGASQTTPTITTNGPNRRVVSFFIRNGTGGVADSWTSTGGGVAERDDFQETGGHTYGAVYDEEKATAGSVSRTATATAGNATNNGRNTLTFIAALAPTPAVPPADVTFGETNILAGTWTPAVNEIRLCQFTLDQALEVSKLTVYAAGTAGALKLKGLIYADSGDLPAAKLGEAPEITIAASSAGAWRDMTFATPVVLAAGTYWIGFIADSANGSLRHGSGGKQFSKGGTYTSGGPNPAGTPSWTDANHVSVYATGTPTTVSTPPSTDRWGFATGFPESTWPDAYRNDFYQRMYADGARRVRFDIANGTAGSIYDKHVTSALAAGLKVLVIVVGSPSDTTTTYAARATAIATYYKNRLVGAGGAYPNDTFEWELMNEPNNPGHPWPSAAAYAAVAKAGSDAIKTVYANANLPVPEIQLGGICNVGAPGNPVYYNPDNWLSAIQAWSASNGGTGWYSKVQYHHYGHAKGRSAIDSFNVIKAMIERLRSIMVAGGDAAKPIVAGEGGAPTWSDGVHTTDSFTESQSSQPGVPEHVQADILRFLTAWWKTLSYADHFYNFMYRDNAGLVASATSKELGDQHGHFGIRYNNYDPKPAMAVWLAAVASNPAQAPVNTVAPSISGTAAEDSQLTADEGTWSNDPTSFTYQWKRANVAISGATSKTYIVQSADVGQAITVTVTATNSAGSASATSSSVTPVSAVAPPANTAAPAVTGTAQVGETLSCSDGTWTGTAPVTIAKQWQRDTAGDGVYANIAGATSSTYVLAPADHGHKVRCQVTATNLYGTATASSNATALVTTVAPANTAVPVISGTPTVGSTLSASTGTWSNTPASYAYQWKRGGTAIVGATSAQYVVQNADNGSTLTVTVTATNQAGSAEATSATTAAVTGGTAVVIIEKPVSWRIALCDLNGNRLAWLHTIATDRTGVWKLNRPATLTFHVPSDHANVATIHTDGLPLLEEQCRTIKAWHLEAGTYVLRFTGLVWNVQDDGDETGVTTEVTCFDPLQMLSHRDILASDGDTIWEATGSEYALWTNKDQTTIARNLVDRSNTFHGPTGLTTSGGQFDTTVPRTIVGAKGMIAPFLTDLMETADGFDLRLDYLDQTDGVLARFNAVARAGVPNPNTVFNWGTGQKNVQRTRRLKQGDKLANSISGWGGPDQNEIFHRAEDATSVARYRRRRAHSVRPEIQIQPFIEAVVLDELAFRKQPREVVEFFPLSGLAPAPWINLQLGDTVTVNVGARLRGGFSGLQRIHGWELDMGDVEKVTKILTSPE
jgi:hypothetical protein